MASSNPNQPAGTLAYDEGALKSFYALCRSYSEIKTYESARAMFFEDYGEYKTEIQEVWPEINEASVCEVYLGPPYKSKGIINENQDKFSTGTYFDYDFTEFKKIGLLTGVNPRHLPEYRFQKKVGPAAKLLDAANYGNRAGWLDLNWNTDENGGWNLANLAADLAGGASQADQYPPPAAWQGATSGKVAFATQGGVTDLSLDVSNVTKNVGKIITKDVSQNDNLYFISPGILNALARYGVWSRNDDTPESGQYAYLYGQLMQILFDMCAGLPGFNEHRGAGWIPGHPGREDGDPLAHVYLLAKEFITDPETLIEHLDDPKSHPNADYHWLDPQWRLTQPDVEANDNQPFKGFQAKAWGEILASDASRFGPLAIITATVQTARAAATGETDTFTYFEDTPAQPVPGIMNQSDYVLVGIYGDDAQNFKAASAFLSANVTEPEDQTIGITGGLVEAIVNAHMGFLVYKEGDAGRVSDKFTLYTGEAAPTVNHTQEIAPVYSGLEAFKRARLRRRQDIFQFLELAEGESPAQADSDDADTMALRRQAAKEAQLEAAANRRPLTPTDIQCYLLENIRRLSNRTGALAPTYKHIIPLGTNNQPGLVRSRLSNRLDFNQAREFLSICPEVQAALVPYFKLYRVDYNNKTKKPIAEKEIKIPNFVEDDDLEEFMAPNGKGRLNGAGMKKFTWSLDGVQPAEVDNNISATLEMYFQSINDFFNADQAGLKEASFLDLIIASPGLDEDEDQGADPKVKGATCPKKDASGHLSRRYEGANFRIKVVAGWSVPTNFKNMFPDMTEHQRKDLQKALQTQKIVLYLQQTRHNINLGQDGTVNLTVNYQAALSGILTAQGADIFAARSAEVNDRLKELELEQKELRKQKSEKAKAALKEALEEQKKLENRDKLQKYRQLLMGLFREGKIYNLALDRQNFLEAPIGSLDPESRARRALRNQKRNLEITTGFGPENNILLESISDAINQGKTAEDAAKDTSIKGTKKYDLLGDPKNRSSVFLSSYFYLGDLIDNVIEQIKLNNDGVPLDFKMYLSETAMIDPLQAFKIKNLDQILQCGQDVRDAAFLTALYESDPYNFSKEMGVTQLMNIGDIPISLDAFQIWFKDKVVKPGKERYYLLHFIKDICADLITGALSSDCFGPNLRFIQRFDAVPVQIDRKTRSGKPGRKLPLRSLVGATQRANDPSKGPDQTLPGLVLLSTDSKPKKLLGMDSYDSDLRQGVYHHYLGSTCGLVKSINFVRFDQPYLRESRIQKEGALGAEQLRELYSANIELYGNTLYKNGNYIYINPALIGATEEKLNTLGLHGYYLVTGVSSTISESGFNVSVAALYEGQTFRDSILISPETFEGIQAEEEPYRRLDRLEAEKAKLLAEQQAPTKAPASYASPKERAQREVTPEAEAVRAAAIDQGEAAARAMADPTDIAAQRDLIEKQFALDMAQARKKAPSDQPALFTAAGNKRLAALAALDPGGAEAAAQAQQEAASQ